MQPYWLRDSTMFSAWIFVMERATRRDLWLRPHRVIFFTKLRLSERDGTLLTAALRGSVGK